MTSFSIPVDLFNPGQVIACLGFLEAAETLIGGVEGGFDWSGEEGTVFRVNTDGEKNLFELVLDFLAHSKIEAWAPNGYVAGKTPNKNSKDEDFEEDVENEDVEPMDEASVGASVLNFSETFPAKEGDPMTLPVRLTSHGKPDITLSHWADGSGRDTFKLYSGNRSAYSIAQAMLLGLREKPKKNEKVPIFKTKGIAQLWESRRDDLIKSPFDVLTPMGGSFNFDPRGAWTAIDAGYSPNDQNHQLAASPVVEFLAAWGLEHARPDEFKKRRVRYHTWSTQIPVELARAALVGGIPSIPSRQFCFDLVLSGKNKVVTFSQEEFQS